MDSLFETRLRSAFNAAMSGSDAGHQAYLFGHSIYKYVGKLERYSKSVRKTDWSRDLSCVDCGISFTAYSKSTKRCMLCRCINEWRLGFANQLRKAYDISLDDYAEMYNAQEGLCAICFSADPDAVGYKQRMSVDHDHQTGQVRGLLCNHCNRGLGQFHDDLTLLRNAVTYLERWN